MGNRRTVTANIASDQAYLELRRNTAVKNRRPRNSMKINSMRRLMITNGNLKSRSFEANDTTSIPLDILATAGISIQTNTNRNKKSFSLMKQTDSNMIIRNPRILDITTYKNLPKKPVFANSVVKNQNDPFYKADSVRSEFEKDKFKKQSRPPIDLSMFVLQAYQTTISNEHNTLRAFQGITKGGS